MRLHRNSAFLRVVEHISNQGCAARARIATKSALELMLSTSGFTFSYYDCHRAGVKRWDALVEYHVGKRVSLVATYSHQ